MVALRKIPARMTVSEFLNWEPGDGGRWQLIDGEPHAMAPTNRTHGALQNELGALIRNHLAERRSPCSVITEPGVIPRLLSEHNVRIPDLGVTCSDYAVEEPTLADPVLLIEILSPSNEADTWANVWAYTSLPSVAEILIVRSDAIGAHLLRRDAESAWPERPEVLGADAVLRLDSIGFALPLREAYARTRLARA